MAITTQLNLEHHLQIDVGSEPDTTVTYYRDTAQAMAEDFCERFFDYATAQVDTLDGDGQKSIIQVSRWPIVTLTSVTESGVTLTVDEGFVAYLTQGLLIRTSGGGRVERPWRNHLRGIVATYDGGYQVAQTGDGATAPDSLIDTLTRIAGRLFLAGTHDLAGVASQVSLDGVGAVTYRPPVFGGSATPIGPSSSDSPALLAEEKEALAPYVNPGIV